MKSKISKMSGALLSFMLVWSFACLTPVAEAQVDPENLKCLLGEECPDLLRLEIPIEDESNYIYTSSTNGEYIFVPIRRLNKLNIYKKNNDSLVLHQEINHPQLVVDSATVKNYETRPPVVDEDLMLISRNTSFNTGPATHYIYRLVNEFWKLEYSSEKYEANNF